MFTFTGEGACRGEGWQDAAGWPMVMGQKTLLQCGNLCAYTLGCTAFDVRPNDAKKLECTLFSHSSVEPASGVPGKSFTWSVGKYLPFKTWFDTCIERTIFHHF